MKSGTVTVHFPESFCQLVIGLIKDKGWRIKVQNGWNYTLTLPNGIFSIGDPEEALLDLCKKFASQFHPEVRYHKTLEGLVKDESQVERKEEVNLKKPRYHSGYKSTKIFTEDFDFDFDKEFTKSFNEAMRRTTDEEIRKHSSAPPK